MIKEEFDALQNEAEDVDVSVSDADVDATRVTVAIRGKAIRGGVAASLWLRGGGACRGHVERAALPVERADH